MCMKRLIIPRKFRYYYVYEKADYSEKMSLLFCVWKGRLFKENFVIPFHVFPEKLNPLYQCKKINSFLFHYSSPFPSNSSQVY